MSMPTGSQCTVANWEQLLSLSPCQAKPVQPPPTSPWVHKGLFGRAGGGGSQPQRNGRTEPQVKETNSIPFFRGGGGKRAHTFHTHLPQGFRSEQPLHLPQKLSLQGGRSREGKVETLSKR